MRLVAYASVVKLAVQVIMLMAMLVTMGGCLCQTQRRD